MNTPLIALFLLMTPEALAVVQAPVAEQPDAEYQACIDGVHQDVEKGRAAALEWVADGGGAPAEHCLAVADLAAGFPKLAAIRLQELGEKPEAGDNFIRARILSQSALAWIEADEPEQAQAAIDEAFILASSAEELYLTAAAVHAANNRQQATIDAVTKAEEAGFTSVRGYNLRARARMTLSQYREAANDVVAALSVDPFNLDALVLRGELAQAGIDIGANYQRADKPK